MSRFYGSLQGTRGEATRQGHRSIVGHIRGWNLGARVTGFPASERGIDGDSERDAFVVDVTGGSTDGFPTLYGALTVSETRGGARRIVVSVGGQGFVTYQARDGSFHTREPAEVEAP